MPSSTPPSLVPPPSSRPSVLVTGTSWSGTSSSSSTVSSSIGSAATTAESTGSADDNHTPISVQPASSFSSLSQATSTATTHTTSHSTSPSRPGTTTIHTTVIGSSGGRVYTTVIETASVVSRDHPGAERRENDPDNGNSERVIGGLVGGLASLVISLVLIFLLLRHLRRRRFRDVFDGNFDPGRDASVRGKRDFDRGLGATIDEQGLAITPFVLPPEMTMTSPRTNTTMSAGHSKCSSPPLSPNQSHTFAPTPIYVASPYHQSHPRPSPTGSALEYDPYKPASSASVSHSSHFGSRSAYPTTNPNAAAHFSAASYNFNHNPNASGYLGQGQGYIPFPPHISFPPQQMSIPYTPRPGERMRVGRTLSYNSQISALSSGTHQSIGRGGNRMGSSSPVPPIPSPPAMRTSFPDGIYEDGDEGEMCGVGIEVHTQANSAVGILGVANPNPDGDYTQTTSGTHGNDVEEEEDVAIEVQEPRDVEPDQQPQPIARPRSGVISAEDVEHYLVAGPTTHRPIHPSHRRHSRSYSYSYSSTPHEQLEIVRQREFEMQQERRRNRVSRAGSDFSLQFEIPPTYASLISSGISGR